MIRLEIRLVHPAAKLPMRARKTDAGYDLFSVEDKILLPATTTVVATGLQIAAPPGYYYTIEGRSSLWLKKIVPNRGIIDATYCGDVIVSLNNFSTEAYKIKTGDRIAQLLLHEQVHAFFEEVPNFSKDYSERGTAGFGSTGR